MFKKVLFFLALSMAAAFPSMADEGMWLLPTLQKLNGKVIKYLGCRLSPDEIYSINHSSLKDAIVQFGGGCTGEMISDEGLLVTNHHCGYSSIQGLSTPEHNYLEDGYWAMTRDKEIPVPGLSVTFLVNMKDITDDVASVRRQAGKKGLDAQALVDSFFVYVQKEVSAMNPDCEVEVMPFYNENVFYLMTYKTYRDIRFVGAPPASMGKFGGETDNWMWPRQTCDFSMFRVYAGADNKPASYSPDNVPYVPARSLKISLKGMKPGDYAMIMGYPGRTQRFQTASQLEEMMRQNGIAVRARTARQNVMVQGMESDPAIRLKYANKYASSANGWKKWQGEQLAFDKLGIIPREKQKEADFMAWVSKNSKREAEYGKAIAQIDKAVAADAHANEEGTLIQNSIYTIWPISPVGRFNMGFRAALRKNPSDTASAIASGKAAALALFKDYDEALERKMGKVMLRFYLDNTTEDSPLLIDGVDLRTADSDKYIDGLFDATAFRSPETLDKIKTQKDLLNDPATKFSNAVSNKLISMYANVASRSKDISEGNRILTKGLLEWQKGKASYPDANFTMRLTYGTVGGYSPKDGVEYKYYTTLDGVMEKEDSTNYEFIVPARLKELYAKGDFGQYADASDGKVHTCFLTNNDITGGNSGSPVLDAEGNLIGLAFDGNWESMSSDVCFEPNLQRCICVDIRYVLFAMEKVGGAGYLLDEMNIVK